MSQIQSFTQKQRLQLSQSMQQSLRVLQMDGFSLRKYLTDLSMGNPLFSVKESQLSGSLDDWENYSSTENINSRTDLYSYLIQQAELRFRNSRLLEGILAIIDNLDLDGFFHFREETFIQQYNLTDIQFRDALTLVQTLDPIGVGARSIQEALELQAMSDSDCPDYVVDILTKFYDEFLHNKQSKIVAKLKMNPEDYIVARHYIGTLSIRPASSLNNEPVMYQIPDIQIKIEGNRYRISLTKFGNPELVFDSESYDSLTTQMDEELKSYLNEKMREYKGISINLKRREDTLLAIANLVIKKQWQYLLGKKDYIEPLILQDIAQAAHVSESTVSRTLNGKFLDTPRGVVSFISLFSKRSNIDNTDLSNKKEFQQLKMIISNESNLKPYSDQQIAVKLKDFGIDISRRTVAKYRSQLGIPKQSDRKYKV